MALRGLFSSAGLKVCLFRGDREGPLPAMADIAGHPQVPDALHVDTNAFTSIFKTPLGGESGYLHFTDEESKA